MNSWKQLSRLGIIIGFLVLLVGLSTVTVGQKGTSIKINRKVKVKGQNLKLGDIATIKGPPEVKNELEDINLGVAPLPGYTRVLKRDYIFSSLKRQGFSLERFSYQIPVQVRITTRFQELKGKRLIKKAREYIYQQLDLKFQDINIEFQQVLDQIKLPVGKVKLQIGNLYSQDLLGRSAIPVNIYVDGELIKKKHLQAKITAYQKVLVAQNLIKRHQALSEKKFKWERRSISNLYGNRPFTDLTSIQKFRLKRTINPGQVLTKRMLELPPLVKRRSEVKIIAKIGGVRVSTEGIALDSGTKGEIIKVRNLNSGQELMAKIWKKDTVKVIL